MICLTALWIGAVAAGVTITGSAELLNHREVVMHAFWSVDVPNNRLTMRLRCNADGWFAVVRVRSEWFVVVVSDRRF